MNHNKSDRERSEDLRREAEARVREFDEETEEVLSEIDARALVHELQVHQIELTMQNEELLRARSQAEDAVEKYVDLYDFAPIGYLTLDHKGMIVESNLAAAEMLGVTRSELAGTNFRLYVARDSLVGFEGCLHQMLESGEKSSCELRLQRGGRPAQHVRFVGSATPGTRERPRQCRAAVIDISELTLAEAKLRRSYDELEERVTARTYELAEAREESERRAAELQAVLAGMADGVMLSDISGDITFVNDAGMEILGAVPDETFEDWGNRFRRFTLDNQPIENENGATCRALRGEIVRNLAMIGITPWGKELTISVSASPIRDPEGRMLGATTIFHDITERVEFQKQRDLLLEREHRIAEVLQQALVPPQREYQFGSCRIAVNYKPASDEAAVGGDFYDVFDLGEGRFGIVIGDITGKGLQAAFRVAAIRHSIRSYAYLDSSPAMVMTRVNEAMCRGQEDASEMLTAFFGVVNTDTGEIVYTSAGHEPPFVRGREGEVAEPNHTCRALGVLDDYAFSESTYQLQPGDLMVIITDGITEAMDAEHEFFGREGIVEYLRRPLAGPPDEIAAGLLECATSYAQGKLRDDAAILALEFGK